MVGISYRVTTTNPRILHSGAVLNFDAGVCCWSVTLDAHSVCSVMSRLLTVHCGGVRNVECKKAQPKEVMFPPGTRGRARGLPYTMDAFMLGMGMLSKCHLNFLLTIIHTLTLSITAVI
ncbi:hypothetical protein PO909_003033 [Leuciscus waleckii]